MAEVIPRSNGTGNLATVEDKFEAALNVIKSLPKNGSYKPDPRMMLKFYSYYKQATEGPCTKPKPWAWDIINKAKWDAWSKLGDMPREKAMEEYVENLKLIVEVMPVTENVQSFVQTLGNFYELVDLEPPEQFKKHSKSMTSTPRRDVGQTLNGHSESHCKTNGDIPSDSSDSENEEIPPNGHSKHLKLNGDAPADEHEQSDQGSEHKSDSEDEFCDTTDEIQASGSAMHSYTMVNNGERTESSTKSDSLSTLDSSMDVESPPQDESYSTTGTVKARTRGGERGTRGSDRTSVPQGLGPNHSGRVGGRPQQRGIETSGRYPGASGGDGGGRGPPYSYSEVQDQIATTLLQLQEDMNSVLNRLSILEALTVGQQARRRTVSGDSSASGSPRHSPRSRNMVPSWWPFRELSPKTLFFIIAWPFVAKWIMHVLNKRRMRR